MNILKHEMKSNLKSLLIWSISMALLVISGMGKYTAYAAGGDSSDIFDKMPHTMKALFGFASFDVKTLSGFYAFLFTYIAITLAIHAVLLGNSIVAKEERDKTTEFLMAKPVSRRAILTAKLLSAAINLVLLNAVTLVSSLLIAASFDGGSELTSVIIWLLVSMLILQVLFLSFGTLLASRKIKTKATGSIASGIVIATYFLAKITDLTDRLNFLNILSPFKYFSYPEIIKGNGLNIFIVVLTLLLSVFLIWGAYKLYTKRDLAV
ncbi:ABC transporter permease subunit [Anaerocolumna sp. AGMB13020]|uniref:ABC transporter permease subunit n=1 Tax=Anaerocolumna sp. AGMB13020 TaxID=3081750 RepID=UPI0029542C9B|nr:ABC transporter permease subunit [Anaerocolumna sp. AGMB13020]WOO36340.1 ABC transporter permease subunit [Anaerocolumna sp. AGMB13020]